MNIKEHADRTEELVGLRAEDIHKWIDGLFDAESFALFLRAGNFPGFDPYSHRKYRHCKEALEEAYLEFKGKYSRKEIKAVFEQHIRDDYDGYLPEREDFENGTFTEKYHERDMHIHGDRILSKGELDEYFRGKSYTQFKHESKKQSSGFRFRIVLPTVVALGLFIASIFIIIVPVFENNMLESKKEMIKELTNEAASVIDYYISLEEKGDMSREDAQRVAVSEIEKIRYGAEGKDYFWITDMTPVMIMHPYRPDLVGRDLTYYTDSSDNSGKRLFYDFVRLVEEEGEGYLEYLWQWKDDPSTRVPKLSYVEGISRWGWIIGTGIYIHDVEEEMNRLIKNLLIVFGIIALGVVLLLTSIVFQSRKIEQNWLRAEMGLKEAKDRYRALVEASNEGYILEVGGKIIYSNHTMQRLLGYSEDELVEMPAHALLDASSSVNTFGIEHLKALSDGAVNAAQFEAQALTRHGLRVEVMISTSRIFFARKNGHIITFRRITYKKSETPFEKHDSIYTGSQILTRPVGDIYSPLEAGTSLEEVLDNLPEITVGIHDPLLDALVELGKSPEGIVKVDDYKGNILGTLSFGDVGKTAAGLPGAIVFEIEKSRSPGHVIRSLNKLPHLVSLMTMQGVKPATLRTTIGKIFDLAIIRFINLSVEELGEPPVSFAFLTLGSNARHEMTLFSDQDNAIVFDDSGAEVLEENRSYFLQLAQKVCTRLDQAGYEYCSGGIMAANPKWCLSLSEWDANFARWIDQASPKSILDLNVIMDINCIYGDRQLADRMKGYLFQYTKYNPRFFLYYSNDCLNYAPPLGIFGGLKGEWKEGARRINIKEHLKPIESFARLYALKHKIQQSSTITRLKALVQIKVVSAITFREIEYVFNYLWGLRFHNQIVSHSELRESYDELYLDTLTDLERRTLRDMLSNISTFQSKISFDFQGHSL